MEPRQQPQCGPGLQSDASVHWRVWAPRARRVELVLLDGERRQVLPMEPEERGYFRLARPGIAEGQRYAYRLDGGPERPDPASLWQPDGVHQPSAVLFPEHFAWAEQGWSGLPREELVFYELHVGTFTPEGTFDAVIPRLDALRELGVTAVELMPVGQFPGRHNWGYDGVHPYAPQNSYGGPHALQRLVNACHTRGLAVFLDVVYNHLGPEGNYLAEFGPYFTDRYLTPWGPALNFDGSDAVRDFFLDNVRLWLHAYRMDGLRLDATHVMFDMGPRHILRAIKETADAAAAALGRRAHVIAENNRNDVRILLPPERGGYGLDAEWNDDFHHAVHAYMTGDRQGYYVDFGPARHLPKVLEQTFVLDGIYSHYRGRRFGGPAAGLPGDRFVASIQNHDQVGNRAGSERLATLLRPPAVRLAASLLLLSPRLPLLFMGEEYGETSPFLFFCSFADPQLIDNVRRGRLREYAGLLTPGGMPDPHAEATFAASRLSWSWPGSSERAGLRQLYQDLLTARRQWPALRDFMHRRARLLPDEERAAVLELVRGEGDAALAAYFNLTAEEQPLPLGAGSEMRWVFSSESGRYGGARPPGTVPGPLLPYECVVFSRLRSPVPSSA
jgi:maltooligosyltrehalose trehalohydrolase